ncbi:DUF1385 domain-containing protein [Candidatus Woesearchaeota archaeon]|nr:DUF1385 domain-containing protein [Candidatus Woesearchaeota archaeon]
MSYKKINVGGQAVIEGVLIRGPSKYVVAVRKGRKIISKKGLIPKKKYKFLKLPFIRGFVNLADMLVIGIKSLMWSAEQAGDDKEKISKNELAITMFFSIVIVVIFFIALPYFLTNLLGFYEEKKPVLFNLIDGMIRILIFLTYIFAISLMKDVKILFQYHGAEHKAIHCYEKEKKLTVNNVKKFTTLHPRCGTSFLLIVFIVSIFVFSLLPSVIMVYYPDFMQLSHWLRKGILFPVRILLIPVIAGISYEILKISDKKQNNFLFKLISMPGLWLQKITTKEPSKKQIEVAIYSLKRLLEIERK